MESVSDSCHIRGGRFPGHPRPFLSVIASASAGADEVGETSRPGIHAPSITDLPFVDSEVGSGLDFFEQCPVGVGPLLRCASFGVPLPIIDCRLAGS